MKLLRNRAVPALALVATVLSIALVACSPAATPTPTLSPTTTAPTYPASAGKVMPTESNPIVIDTQARETRIAARVNGSTFTAPTWHGVVYNAGKASGAAVFQAFASPGLFYDAMKFFDGQPGNNMPMENYSSTYVKGSDIDVSVTWVGAPKVFTLDEVLKNPDSANGKSIKIKFGGNYDRIESGGTGCITCLYSCPMGISSNASYNGDDFARQKAAGQAGFLANKDVLPADGTPVVIIYKVK